MASFPSAHTTSSNSHQAKMTVGNMYLDHQCNYMLEIDSDFTAICPRAPRDCLTVEIDPDGDLCLVVGETVCLEGSEEDHGHDIVQSFTVCSRTVARASPVFKRMLYGGFKESKRTNGMQWIVELPEDNSRAMEMLLSIVHARFETIPRQGEVMSLRDLYELTVLTDKYDLTHILRPWAKSWVAADCIQWPNTNHILDMERQVWIGWELGDKTLFERGARGLVLNSSSQQLFAAAVEPPGMSDMVSDIRLQTIERFIQPFQTAISLLMKKDYTEGRKSLCYHYHNRDRCEAIMLGSLIRSFSSNGLWPLPSPSDIEISVVELAAIIISFHCLHLDNYHKCLPVSGATEKIDDILRNLKVNPTESQKVHIERQAKTSGLAS